jgi:hypothetical protein
MSPPVLEGCLAVSSRLEVALALLLIVGSGGIMAETEVVISKNLVAPSLGPVAVEPASEVSDWAIVFKEGMGFLCQDFPPYFALPLLARGKGSVCVFKGDGLELSVTTGFEVVCEEGRRIHESVSSCCLDVDFFREEPIFYMLLSSCCPGADEIPDCSGLETSNWVLQKVKDFRHIMGSSCEGFEEELKALPTTIETSRYHEGSASSCKLVNRGNRELKRLSCSIDYDSGGSSTSSQGRVKGI